MHTPLDRPSVPAGGCCSTGPPITFSAAAAGMIAQTSIFFFAPDPEPAPEPVVDDDVDVSADVEPELLPHAASAQAAVTATATILMMGRMATDSSEFRTGPITVRGSGSPPGDRGHTARREAPTTARELHWGKSRTRGLLADPEPRRIRHTLVSVDDHLVE